MDVQHTGQSAYVSKTVSAHITKVITCLPKVPNGAVDSLSAECSSQLCPIIKVNYTGQVTGDGKG